MWIKAGCRGVFKVKYSKEPVKPAEIGGEDVIMCESWDLKRTECRGMAPISWMSLEYKRSWRQCTEGTDYGLAPDRRSVWIDNGASTARGRAPAGSAVTGPVRRLPRELPPGLRAARHQGGAALREQRRPQGLQCARYV